jgi:hypothetical protein
MAFNEVGNEANLNGTTNVPIVPAPASGERNIVSNVHFYNKDVITHNINVVKDKGGTAYPLAQLTVAAGAHATFTKVTVLDATDETIYANMAEIITTTNPSVDVAYANVTP